MAKHRFSLLLISLLIYLFGCAQTNRALVVTISEYPVYSGWEELHSYNDKRLILSFLKSYFRNNNIITISEANATKKNIVRGLQRMLELTESGDYVYLHFSCHGQQMMDDNGDEEDGLDEALIPYDAGFWYKPGVYEGENHLRDDELGLWIDRIRKKAGDEGNITVVLDACHSGTANRENEYMDYARGTAAVFAPEGYKPVPGKHPDLSLHLISKSGFAQATVFSACLSHETNYEYYDRKNKLYYGFLTYAFIQTTLNTDNKRMSARTFLNELKMEMQKMKPGSSKRKQTPYMECTDVDMYFNLGQEKR